MTVKQSLVDGEHIDGDDKKVVGGTRFIYATLKLRFLQVKDAVTNDIEKPVLIDCMSPPDPERSGSRHCEARHRYPGHIFRCLHGDLRGNYADWRHRFPQVSSLRLASVSVVVAAGYDVRALLISC